MTAAPDIFLSYNREDQAVARRFAEAFEAAGLSVWWDQTLRSGETYDEVTEAALRGAKAVVVLWSPRSVASHWVRAEATIAHRAKTLVPATIESCDKPVMFELTQTADLSRWRGEPDDPSWRAFLADVQRFVRFEVKPAAVVVAAAPDAGARPALAVLPFVSRAGLPDDDDFADELVEELIAALSSSPWMVVVASSATAGYGAGGRDLRKIGRDLAARYLFEGKMRRIGDDLRITAQLVAAEEGKVLWTQKFDHPFTELARFQDELAVNIAAHLGQQIERAERERALRKTSATTAWDGFIRAVAHFSRTTRAGYEDSVSEAKRAIAIDPNFGLAYAILVASQSLLLAYRGDDGGGLAREVADNIRRARALAPDDPTVLAACATASYALGKPLDALPFAERAVANGPNLDLTHGVRGIVLIQLGRIDEGLAGLDEAERLAPDSLRNNSDLNWRTVAHLHAGRLDQAQAAAEHAVSRMVSPESLVQNALCWAIAGNDDRARNAMSRARDADPELSRRNIENLVRHFHHGCDRVDEYVAVVCKAWDGTAGEVS
jgi:TolB-like protein